MNDELSAKLETAKKENEALIKDKERDGIEFQVLKDANEHLQKMIDN